MIEIRMILADLGCKILSQKEAGIQADVVEDGQMCIRDRYSPGKDILQKY